MAHKLYGQTEVGEHPGHRHRYEFNREYEKLLFAGGTRISGTTLNGT